MGANRPPRYVEFKLLLLNKIAGFLSALRGKEWVTRQFKQTTNGMVVFMYWHLR